MISFSNEIKNPYTELDKSIGGRFADNPATNACKLCAPLGASLVFKGIENCVPLIHGSQGCATYIRRYLISHFREPMDIASSSFAESSTIFGGAENFNAGIDNIISQYTPDVVGVCTSCLSETIGEDPGMLLGEYRSSRKDRELPAFINVATPSYSGNHMDGFNATVKAAVRCLCENGGGASCEMLNIFPGLVSPADMRYLKEILDDFGIDYMMLPDYSESLDSPTWDEYHKLPPGGTPRKRITQAASARASLQFGRVLGGNSRDSIGAGEWLEKQFKIKCLKPGMPIGIKESDIFFKTLETLSGKPMPEKYKNERGRLIDSYIDGHKYLFGKRAIIFGEEDFVVGMTALLSEIGVHPVVCGSGGESPHFADAINAVAGDAIKNFPEPPIIVNGADFESLLELALETRPDFLIGNSKGYYISRQMNLPLIRCGFPVHDRIGAQRLLHLGYRGAQQLFDAITNAVLEYNQDNSPMGYKYM
ncbi:MAG: hypothetical protein JXR78_01330 [Victivallales bacterium]|nr:hypothetical protein [Victivallales bacterium]